MKKTGLLVAVVLLLALFVGCGAGDKAVAEAEAQLGALDAHLSRASEAIAAIDTAAGNVVDATFGEALSALAANRDALAAAVETAQEMSTEEREALLQELYTATSMAEALAGDLEAIRPEIEALSSGAQALANNLGSIAQAVQGGGATPAQQQEYSELAAAYQGLESQLNATLATANGGDLGDVLAALQEANATLAQTGRRAAVLLEGL